MPASKHLSASFRDPSGFLFVREEHLYRQVNRVYQKNYDQLMSSGLYDRLCKNGWLVAHEEKDVEPQLPELAYRILAPERVHFISYPYEWSFSQLKDAALLTLEIQKLAMEYGMSLKDASAYNIQFHRGRPVLIDTLSFEIYPEGKPWIAYRQFCQHFLAPLALMAFCDIRLNQLLRVYIDGVPLDMASALLPWKTRMNFGLLTHVHTHAAAQKRYSNKDVKAIASGRQIGRMAFLGLIDSLENTVRALNWTPAGTEWADYYDATNYSQAAFEEKQRLIAAMLQRIQPQTAWDLGANTGLFSRLASQMGVKTLALDIDPSAVEKNYLDCKKSGERNMLPLVMDLTNPSPGIGWANEERDGFAQRGPADVALALALVHHLAISNNVPLPDLVDFLAQLGKWLIVEFVPKEDSQVQRLLLTREDIFPHYNREDFERALSERYHVRETHDIEGTRRTLYCLERKAVS